MRVLLVYRDHFADLPGGIERHVQEVAQGLSAHGFEIETVASARFASTTTNEGSVVVHVERQYGRPGGVPLAPGVIRRARTGFDVVHVHSPNPTGEWAALRARSNAAIVATYHADTDRGRVFGSIYRKWLVRNLQRFDRILVASERLVGASPVLSELPRDAARIEVVPFGVDIDRFTPADHGAPRRWGDEPLVLFLGRLRYYKGVTHLIDAMAGSSARLLVIGDGRERREIEARGRSVLGDRFIFLPGIAEEQLVDAYRAADLFCLPSTSPAEAFGLAALEAMACGLPVVTTELGTATSEINIDGVTGVVVPPRDVGSLSAAIEGLLDDDERRARFGRAARERAVAEYGRELMLERIAAIYRDVATERKLGGDG